MELFGTHGSGICGFGISGQPMIDAILPMLLVGEGFWNGIAIANPNDSDVELQISLMSGSGVIKTTKRENLASRNRFKAVVETFFESTTIQRGDYIKVVSNAGVVATQTAGSTGQEFLMALAAIPAWHWFEWKL